MLAVIKQFKRIYNDNGRDDKNFDLQEQKLRIALNNLKLATNRLIRASQGLTDILAEDDGPKLH